MMIFDHSYSYIQYILHVLLVSKYQNKPDNNNVYESKMKKK